MSCDFNIDWCCFLTVFALQKLSTNRMLIKINYSKVIFLLLYLFKGIIMTFILLSVLPVSELGYQYINNTSTKDLKVYSDYAVFFQLQSVITRPI